MATPARPSPLGAPLSGADIDTRAAFSVYHRHRLRGQFARRFPLIVGAVAVLVGMSAWSLNSPHPAGAATGPEYAASGSTQLPGAPENSHAGETPGVAQPAAIAVSGEHRASAPQSGAPDPAGPDAPDRAEFTPPALPQPGEESTDSAPGARMWDIAVTARGHQAEIDACEWVRVDVDAVAPILGAHNNCGGHIVLDMRMGDLVQVRGEEVDGLYQVTEERPALAGAIAATATAGMQADLIAQTCLWEGEGRLRLLSLTLVKGNDALS